MTTSERQWSGGWVEPVLPLTWSVEDSPASPSASPAEASPRPTNAGSGLRRGPSFATYDRSSRSWRTYRVCLDGDSETYSATWPRSGMTRSGTAYPLPPSAPLTDVTGYSWLPTPAASPGGYNQSPSLGAAIRPSLETMARHDLWPTPTVNGNYNRAGLSAKSGDGLATAVAKAEMWPTPTARDATRGRGWDGPGRPLSETVGGLLNPTWVEWLMGFPSGWTDLGPSATPSGSTVHRRFR